MTRSDRKRAFLKIQEAAERAVRGYGFSSLTGAEFVEAKADIALNLIMEMTRLQLLEPDMASEEQ